MTPDQLAQAFHEAYERLAPQYGYETRRDSAVPWDQVPERNRRLMTAVCAELLTTMLAGPVGERPEIVVLCGSTRFHQAFADANLGHTLAGRIVLSIGCDTKSDDELARAGVTFDQGLKNMLDQLHLRKVDLADRVVVLNVGGYIGNSTRAEIAYARHLGKPITYLEPPADAG